MFVSLFIVDLSVYMFGYLLGVRIYEGVGMSSVASWWFVCWCGVVYMLWVVIVVCLVNSCMVEVCSMMLWVIVCSWLLWLVLSCRC